MQKIRKGDLVQVVSGAGSAKAVQGRVIAERPDEDCRFMDPISVKYTGKPFPYRGPDRVCFVIAVEKAGQVTLNFVDQPHSAR